MASVSQRCIVARVVESDYEDEGIFMKLPISVCMITRNDPHLETCINSFKDHVNEICLVITGDDPFSIAVAKKLNCKYVVFEDCNEDDKIVDFSLARNKSLELATQPWIMWIDSDDLVVGMEKLEKLLEACQEIEEPVGFLFPYNYSYNQQGIVTCQHYRERLFNKKDCWSFTGPVHEVLVPKSNTKFQLIKSDDLVFEHRRQFIEKAIDPNRNLRILKKHMAAHPDDARNMYYIGLEYANTGDKESAIKSLTKYIDISGWDDERAMACYKLVEIYSKDFPNALKWAFKSLEIKSDWFESYYQVCKIFYFQQAWQKCIDFGKLALSKPKTDTLLFINENDRYDIHCYLNVAYNGVGDTKSALDSCNQGLLGNPNDPNLINNKRLYEQWLNIETEVELKETNKDCLDIVFVSGNACEYWTPDHIKGSGIGGSETMLIHQARNLAALGHRVRVYAVCDGIYDNVEYINFLKYKNLSCDVLIVSRQAHFLDDSFNIKSHIKYLWCHDVCAINSTSALLLKADKILALSEWHKENLIKVHNIHPNKVFVTRNGIDLERFKKNIIKKPYQCINSSSPDRSWPILLDCWKEIKLQVPEAELHLYYGFHNWKTLSQNDKLQLDLIARLEKQIEETPGVVFHDRVSQDDLAVAFLESKVWLYSTWFSETSCISAMEAQAANCHIITSPIAALNETCAGYDKVTFIDGTWTSPEYKQKFIAATIKVLNEI